MIHLEPELKTGTLDQRKLEAHHHKKWKSEGDFAKALHSDCQAPHSLRMREPNLDETIEMVDPRLDEMTW